MRILKNVGRERVIDCLRPALAESAYLDLATNSFSLFAFQKLAADLINTKEVRIILPASEKELELLGGPGDRAARNRLEVHLLARQCAEWLSTHVDVRRVSGAVPQGAVVLRDDTAGAIQGVTGAFSFTTSGLGLTPGNPMSLVQASETENEATAIADWFDVQWSTLLNAEDKQQELLDRLNTIASDRAPRLIYAIILSHLFSQEGDTLDEERIVRSATGIRDTTVWKKLYSFQRDAVVAAIEKLDRYGGCIIADSVGLGKTFEALAVIKYHELRNDRVLVLCPKRLRENWTLYAVNDRRNVLAHDRFNYDVLNHTDLSRDFGLSGDIDLANLNWGNYDLVVIDESHNFRNKRTPKKGSETRYDRLMRQIVKEGVKTRVLMLTATPVNNRLADLRNQIAFATEANDAALAHEGVESIEATTRKAQSAFNRWSELPQPLRTTERLVDMLGFDYFSLLDKLTIARSRKHVEKYYGLDETGRFPERRPPINVKAEIDRAGNFPSIGEVNDEIRRLRLAAYAPLRYVLPQKQAAYDRKYSTEIRGGESVFRQADREESLIHLMRVNLLKRMESSVASFRLTVERQLVRIGDLLERMEDVDGEIEEPDVEDVDLDDPELEPLLVGGSVKVLLTDVDRIRWRQDLEEDQERLERLLAAARDVTADEDAKLEALKQQISTKIQHPINETVDGPNRKVLIFTAFADTAEYLYEHVSPWAKQTFDLECALVTGSRSNQTTVDGLRKDMRSILPAFAPRAKERPPELRSEGEIDLLIATDCISEGQNLQDCDYLINYDIHWNPVRIIQRFGRIDRIGSPNEQIQLVNFWPNVELEAYIDLEQRVSGRMVLLDVSATGEENVIERQSGDPMNDLDYRREQLKRMQEAVLDLEDLDTGVSITDLTLTDFRIDLTRLKTTLTEELDEAHLGAFAVVTANGTGDVPPGVVFCLRAEGESPNQVAPAGYPLTPYFLVYVSKDSETLLPFTHARQILDRLKRLSLDEDTPNKDACVRFHKVTKNGNDMQSVQRQLATAISSVVGKSEERAIESLFSSGGTHALAGEFAGADAFEVVAFLVVLPSNEE